MCDMSEFDYYISIGDNCEAGLNFERLGFSDSCLFRYARSELHLILDALDNEFDGIFDQVEPVSDDMVKCLRYNISWHTNMYSKVVDGIRKFSFDGDFDSVLEYERNKILYLYSKFIKRLKSGKRLCFFYKSNKLLDHSVVSLFCEYVKQINPTADYKVVAIKERGQSEFGIKHESVDVVSVSFLAPYVNAHAFSHYDWDFIFKKYPLVSSKIDMNTKGIWSSRGEFSKYLERKVEDECIITDCRLSYWCYYYAVINNVVAFIISYRTVKGRPVVSVFDGYYVPLQAESDFFCNGLDVDDLAFFPNNMGSMYNQAIEASKIDDLPVVFVQFDSMGRFLKSGSSLPALESKMLTFSGRILDILDLFLKRSTRQSLSGYQFNNIEFDQFVLDVDSAFDQVLYQADYRNISIDNEFSTNGYPIHTFSRWSGYIKFLYDLRRYHVGDSDRLLNLYSLLSSGISPFKYKGFAYDFEELALNYYRSMRLKNDWFKVRCAQLMFLVSPGHKEKALSDIKSLADSGFPYAVTVHNQMNKVKI